MKLKKNISIPSYGHFLSYGHPLVPDHPDKRGSTVYLVKVWLDSSMEIKLKLYFDKYYNIIVGVHVTSKIEIILIVIINFPIFGIA